MYLLLKKERISKISKLSNEKFILRELKSSSLFLFLGQIKTWINEGKIKLSKKDLCYKKRREKKTSMMNYTKWNIDRKAVIPISLRPKYINKREEIGCLEIDFILEKTNEVKVKSITVDNGLEFETLGITAKKLGVELYK